MLLCVSLSLWYPYFHWSFCQLVKRCCITFEEVNKQSKSNLSICLRPQSPRACFGCSSSYFPMKQEIQYYTNILLLSFFFLITEKSPMDSYTQFETRWLMGRPLYPSPLKYQAFLYGRPVKFELVTHT